MILKFLCAFLVAFIFGTIISPLVLYLCKKLKAKQTILFYVSEHETKNGTPTMGGIIFILTLFIVGIFFINTDYLLSIISLVTTLCFAILGFLDDFLKIHYKQNLGLRAYQKVIGQVGISLILALFVYKSNIVGTKVFIPFSLNTIDLGIFIVPFVMFVFLAVVNSVNLLDGLDGLCSGVSFVYILTFASILLVYESEFFARGLVEMQNIQMLCFVMCGGLLSYFMFNCFPASIFMGDTGSLALGGFIATIAVLTRLELYIPIIGFVYVITALSDVIQVMHYKRTKKRVFLMAPLHHHFQKKGVNENKIVAIYIIVTLVICLTVLAILLKLGE